ncbi:MAG: DUF3078 domain-containing protein [Bacteroidota bacterium]
MYRFWGLIFFFIYSFVLSAQTDSSLIVSENVFLFQINDTTYSFQQDSTQELWFLDNSANSWELSHSTEIRAFYNNSFRLWLQGKSVSLWEYDKVINDWKLTKSFFPEVKKLNDTISFISINDTTKLVTIKEQKYNFKTTDDVFFWQKNENYPSYVVNDTVQLWKINDTTNLWTYQDSSVLWYLNSEPKIWKLSNSTIVWTLDNETEFWKSGNKYNIWQRNEKTEEWEKSKKLPLHYLDPVDIWRVNESLMVWVRNDSVQLWQANKRKKIWQAGDSVLIWKVPPPLIDTIKPDTVIIPEKKVKKAQLMDFEDVKIWSVNDTVKVWDQKSHKELLFLNRTAQLWKINDSSVVWNINHKSKISFMADTIVLWEKNDSTFEWKPILDKSDMQISDSLRVFDVNDSIRFSVWRDSTNMWNRNVSTNISTLSNLEQHIMLNDSTELWEPNDSTKLWIDKYSESGDIWHRNKDVNILNINDSTKIWQINEQVRLSIINNRLKVWSQGGNEPSFPWKELNKTKVNINDTIRIWQIDPETIIWETKHKIEVWNLNPEVKLFRLNDTSLVWTFSANYQARKLKKPNYWSYGGTGKMNISQVYLDNWIKGGESSISMLFIINLMANYNKRKVKWDNEFEYRFGLLKSGENPMRKNNDKIKLQSGFNYYAVDKWYYSFSSSVQTQIFNGYKYPTDTTSVLVSTFSGPLYTTLALGMNYFPLPQLSVFFSPLTQRLVYVNDTTIIDQTRYGVDADKNSKNEPGAIIKTVLNWNLNKNIHLLNKLDFFTSYNNNPEKIDVDWELTLTFKLTNLINTTLSTHLIYDHDVAIPKYNDLGEKIGEGPAVQFKEVLSIGLFYKL